MEGDDVEFLAAELRVLDQTIFRLRDSNLYLRLEGLKSGMEESEVEEVCKENEDVIDAKMLKIKDYVKRFKPDDKDLPLIIPFTFNDLPSHMRADRIIDPNEAIKEAQKKEVILKNLREELAKRKEEIEQMVEEGTPQDLIGTQEVVAEEPDGMYL